MQKSNIEIELAGMPLAYSIPAVCRLSGIGRTSVYAAIAVGHLRARKVGRRTVIMASDLRAWLDACPSILADHTKGGTAQ